jgi:AcrR family transcriptional regulator
VQQKAVEQGSFVDSGESSSDAVPSARRNRELRIAQIILSARQAFQEDGYAEFSARRVAGRVGITLGNIQYYFRTKDDLLRAMLQSVIGQTLDEYGAIATQSGASAARRCSTLVERIFHDITETELPKFLFEALAFAQHESFVEVLVEDMYSAQRKIFAQLLSELHPTLSSEECLVRASVLVAQTGGMMIFAYNGGDVDKDYLEFVRMTKRAVKMIVGLSAQSLEIEGPARLPHGQKTRSTPHISVFGSEEHIQYGRIELSMRQTGQDALYIRPTVQGKRREVKINEIVSTAANLLASEGYANFTQVRVARELGILPSALQNYFPTHDDLLRSTVGALMKAYLDRYAQMGKPSGKPALERLCEIVEDGFEDACDVKASRFSFEMFALAQHSEMTRDLVRRTYSTYRAIFVDLVREIDSSATARECLARATLIAAQIEGAALLTFGVQKQTAEIGRVFDLMRTMAIFIAHGKIATKNIA